MAYDKLVDSERLDAALTDIADAIRLKLDSTSDIRLQEMPLYISKIEGGGGLEKLFETDFTVSENVTANNASLLSIRTELTDLDVYDVLLYQTYNVNTPESSEKRVQLGFLITSGTRNTFSSPANNGALCRTGVAYLGLTTGNISMYVASLSRLTGEMVIGCKANASFPVRAGTWHVDIFRLGNITDGATI